MEIWICLHLKNRKGWMVNFCTAAVGWGSQPLLFLTGWACCSWPQPPHVLQTLRQSVSCYLLSGLLCYFFDVHLNVEASESVAFDILPSHNTLCAVLGLYCVFLLYFHAFAEARFTSYAVTIVIGSAVHTRKGCLTTSGSQDYVSSALQESFIQTACIVALTMCHRSWLFKHFPRVDCEFVKKRDCGLSVFMSSPPLCFQ